MTYLESWAAYCYRVDRWCPCEEWEGRWPVWRPQCKGENPVGHAPGMEQDTPALLRHTPLFL